MTNLPVYVLDANVFIQAERRWYSFDVAPAFWEALVKQAEDGRIVSVDRVKSEIDRVGDALAAECIDTFAMLRNLGIRFRLV
ncbi:MAG: DUF4411 family protein [Bacillota bacterium]